jgi:amidase
VQGDYPAAMKFHEYRQHDALSLADLVRRGEVQAQELLALAGHRADEVQPKLNAFTRRMDDDARQRSAQKPSPQALLGGVPFIVKDLFQDVGGLPSTGGSKAMPRHVPTQDSDVVRRWREAGLLIFGKTNAPEFGAKNVTEPVAYGTTRNPWDTTRTPGGSSGGSAAAVAAGVVPVAGANDGGGSIRIPAAACGLVGLKPGRGRISSGPDMGEPMNGAAVQGVVSRSVRDTAAMMDVLQGPEPHAPYPYARPAVPYLQAMQQSPGRLKIGFTTSSPIGTAVDAQAIAAVQDAARLLESLGHHVEEVPHPVDGKALAQDFLTTWFCVMAELVDTYKDLVGASNRDFEPDTLAMAAVGRSLPAVELLRCNSRWHQHNVALSQYHQRFDLWLSPVLAAPPVKIGELDTPKLLQISSQVVDALGLSGWLRKTSLFQDSVLQNLAWTPYTQLANLTGRPAISLPLYWTPEGLPMGVQFVAALEGEALLLQLAAQLEQARPWFDRHPPI